MELKEIAIVFINAIASTFGFSGPLYNIYLILTVDKFKIKDYLHLYIVLYVTNIIMGFTAIAYLPLIYTIAAFVYFYIQKKSKSVNIIACLSAMVVFFNQYGIRKHYYNFDEIIAGANSIT